MPREDFNNLLAFLAVARERSFTEGRGAARSVTIGPEPHYPWT